MEQWPIELICLVSLVGGALAAGALIGCLSWVCRRVRGTSLFD